MRANEFINEINIDNHDGWGQTPNNASVDYMGLKVLMKPSIFLRLAAELPLDDEAREKIAVMVAHAKKGGSFGAPTLYVSVPEEWEDNVFKPHTIGRVKSHEGRHRMNAQLELEGDVPVETHIFIPYFKTKNWAKDYQNDYTPEIVSRLQQQMESEDGYIIVTNPLFTI